MCNLSRRRAQVLLIGVILACGCCASSSQQLRDRSTEKPADANVLFWINDFVLGGDGGHTETVHQKTIIYTEVAVDDLGDPRVVHNTAREKLEVLKAETTMRDGEVVSIKPNSITETTPDELAKAPGYADHRETVITHVGMEVGCTNELAYRLTSTPAAAGAGYLDASVPLHLPFPIAKRMVRVRVPGGTELAWACLGCDVKPASVGKEGGTEHTFNWATLPRLNLAEAEGAVINEPRLVFTTHGSWQDLSTSLAKRFAGAAKPNKVIRARANDLIERLASNQQRLDAIWRFVANDLATVHWPLGDFELEPRAAAEVLDSSYGHSLDKAVLLSALLKVAKIKARPLLVSRDGLFADSVPAASQFSEVWLVVVLGDKTLWVDPTTVRSGAGAAYLEGRYVFDLNTEKPGRIFLGDPGIEANQSVVVADLALAPDGAVSAEMSISLSGSYSPYAEVTQDRGGDKIAAGVLGRLGGAAWTTDCDDCSAELLHLDAELAAFSFEAKGAAKFEGRAFEVGLPWAPRSNLIDLDFHRATRQTAMTVRSRGLETVKITLTAAASLELRSELPAGKVDNAVGSLVTESRREGEAIIIERTLRIKKRLIDPAEYPGLLELFTELTRRDHRGLLFFKPPPPTKGAGPAS